MLQNEFVQKIKTHVF